MAAARLPKASPTRRPREAAASPAPEVRRRPRQSRARHSALALQQAFVQVLLERGYARTTIREVAGVAGVSVGTFYQYFGNMHALAAKCISETVRSAKADLQKVLQSHGGQPLHRIIDAMLDAQVDAIVAQGPSWSALFILERQVSSPAAFRRHYEDWVSLWTSALAAASDAPPPARCRPMGRMVHAISYGWLSQCLITLGPPPPGPQMRVELGHAVQRYLDGERMAPQAQAAAGA